MNNNICISIPVKFARLSKIKPTINNTIKANPDLIELRFDFINNAQTITIDFLKDLKNIIHPTFPIVFTFRDSTEGGKIKINQEEHLRILKMFIQAKPDYIDIEMNTEKNILSEIINLTSQNNVNLIFSYHNLEKTLNLNEAMKLIQNFQHRLNEEFLVELKMIEKSIFKVIFTAQTFEDNIIPLRLCKEFSNSTQKLISFCMGTAGIFSRIMCVIAGSFFTYASLEEKTAPGQINIDEMREIYHLFPFNL